MFREREWNIYVYFGRLIQLLPRYNDYTYFVSKRTQFR